MAQHAMQEVIRPVHRTTGGLRNPAYLAYQVLHLAFVLVFVLAGADKFFRMLSMWDPYLAPTIAQILPFGLRGFMMFVGVVEIAIGVIVAVRPRLGGYLAAVWFALTITNLILSGRNWDIALRDLGLLLAAIALGRLSGMFDRHVERVEVVRREAT